jgi:hypothetical protein
MKNQQIEATLYLSSYNLIMAQTANETKQTVTEVTSVLELPQEAKKTWTFELSSTDRMTTDEWFQKILGNCGQSGNQSGFSFFGICDPDGWRSLKLCECDKITFATFLQAFNGGNSCSGDGYSLEAESKGDKWVVSVY